MSADLRALLVTYMWPPAGGVGVTRVLKLARYLGLHGVVPSVLTVSNPSVPLRDHSLEREIPEGLEVLRARSLEPGYGAKQAAWRADRADAANPTPGVSRLGPRIVRQLVAAGRQVLIPDPQVLWQPGLLAALVGRLRSPRRDDVVFITAPPFSSFLAAPFVRRHRGVGVILDYRDEWTTLRASYEMQARTSNLIADPLEGWLLRSADAVTVATEAFREALLERFGFLDPGSVVTIPNGYDPSDFPVQRPSPPTDKLVMTYAGTVYKLTSPGGLLRAIRRLHERAPQLASLLRVRFIGRIVETERAAFEGLDRLGVECVGFVPKEQVLPALAASHVVMVIQGDEPGTERIFPGKLMEALYLRRPILLLSRAGAASELVAKHALGSTLPPSDDVAIARYLEEVLLRFREGRFDAEAHPVGIERFDRRSLAGEFAAVFRGAAERAKRRG